MLNRETLSEKYKVTLWGRKAKVPKAITINYIDGFALGKGIFGQSVDPSPFEGEVIIVEEQVVIVQAKKNEFYIIDQTFMSQVPEVGDKIAVNPYFRKMFNGQRINSKHTQLTQYMNGDCFEANSALLGGTISHIPGNKVNNPQLKYLVDYLENTKLSDGYRSVTHMLFDAKATNFIAVDPVSESDPTEPSLQFTVDTAKFKGNVKIIAHENDNNFFSPNQFTVYLTDHAGSEQMLETDDKSLYKLLDEMIDDGSWNTIAVNIIKKAPKKRQ
ncbi:hypothetical protein [Zophobihabitans entericus]|uniref:Uncharacterized protein n=1 Tax=Zophobihabitans entericus TaxID=1635327 RepID=A0A6G9ID38_9GAMM|nr:hypothetical protein [Zophobihabitans entericus]QIQ22145.1 hypothetical protein IPMB12_10890 [Zophobihabitans entericus]